MSSQDSKNVASYVIYCFVTIMMEYQSTKLLIKLYILVCVPFFQIHFGLYVYR